jgi:hypothetical protein
MVIITDAETQVNEEREEWENSNPNVKNNKKYTWRVYLAVKPPSATIPTSLLKVSEASSYIESHCEK